VHSGASLVNSVLPWNLPQTVVSVADAVIHPLDTIVTISQDFSQKLDNGNEGGGALVADAFMALGSVFLGGAPGTVTKTAGVGEQLAFDFMKEPALSGKVSGLVIGRGKALDELPLSTGEYRLGWFDVEDSLGMGVNQDVNLELLGRAADNRLPIRDISWGNNDGFYLNAERDLLNNMDWYYSENTGYWYPPIE